MNKPRATRKPWTKLVECKICKQSRMVRKDSASTTCKSCAAKKSCEAALKVIRAKTKLSNCKTCGSAIPKRLGYTYCSVGCRMEDKKVDRVCKCCSVVFRVYKSAMNGKTNSSGNFCGRGCYEKWMCNGSRTTGRGSQWKKIRDEVIALQPFCSMCGTDKNLQVHHIAPFRISHDNSYKNLMPLCRKHHKIVESITHDIELTGSSADDMTLIIGNILAGHASMQRMKLLSLGGLTPTRSLQT